MNGIYDLIMRAIIVEQPIFMRIEKGKAILLPMRITFSLTSGDLFTYRNDLTFCDLNYLILNTIMQ